MSDKIELLEVELIAGQLLVFFKDRTVAVFTAAELYAHAASTDNFISPTNMEMEES